MRKARFIAAWGICLTLIVLSTPVLALTYVYGAPGGDKDSVISLLGKAPSPCFLCNTLELTSSQPTNPTGNGEILIRMRTGAFDPLLLPQINPVFAQPHAPIHEPSFYLIQFHEPILEDWFRTIIDSGA